MVLLGLSFIENTEIRYGWVLKFFEKQKECTDEHFLHWKY